MINPKHDRQGARTPADLERRYAFEKTFKEVNDEVARIDKRTAKNEASIGLIVNNGEVNGSIVIEAINNESSAKIKADRLDIEGKKLNIKVDATNIEGKVTADQINANGITAEDVDVTGKINAKTGSIGGWDIGDNLSAETTTVYSNYTHKQSVTLTITGITVTSIWTETELPIGGEVAFLPDGVTLGVSYTKTVTWADLLNVYS